MGTDQYLFAKKAKRFVDTGRLRVLSAPDYTLRPFTDMTDVEVLLRIYEARGYWRGAEPNPRWEVEILNMAEAFVRKFPGDTFFTATDGDAYDLRNDEKYYEWPWF